MSSVDTAARSDTTTKHDRLVAGNAAATGPRVLQILGRKRTDCTQMVGLDDFRLREVQVDEDLCASVAGNRHVTPYCLDHENRRMIFAETPPEIELSARPFYYQAQYETATRLIAIPYDRVHEVAAAAHGRPADPVFIFSVGRCGSTLMSKMLGRLDDTYSLSEPDVFTAINYLHGLGRLTDHEAMRLLASAVRLVNRPPTPRDRLVIKFRAQCIGIADLMHRQHPAARLVFMYRNALDCIDSYVRVFGEVPLPRQVFDRAFPYAQSQPDKYRRLHQLGQPILVWLVCAHTYLGLRDGGLPIVAIKYEALIERLGESAARLFAHCGVSQTQVEQACAAITEDAQEGTPLARNADGRRTLSADDREFIRMFFAERGGIAIDQTLAGTING